MNGWMDGEREKGFLARNKIGAKRETLAFAGIRAYIYVKACSPNRVHECRSSEVGRKREN